MQPVLLSLRQEQQVHQTLGLFCGFYACDLANQEPLPAATPTGTPTAQETDIPPAANTPSAFSNIAAIREFTPQQQNYDLTTNGAAAATQDASLNYDPFTMNSVASALPAAQYNPYASTDHTGLVAHGGAYFPSAQAGYQSLIPPVRVPSRRTGARCVT